MTFMGQTSYYDILILLEDRCLLYRFQKTRRSSDLLHHDSFSSLDDALLGIPKNRELYLITLSEHFFEDELTLGSSVKDLKIVRILLDEQLGKNLSIKETPFYHFHEILGDKKESASSYYLYGYAQKEYLDLEERLKSFTNLRLLTSSRQLLYNLTKLETKSEAPFISVYRFLDSEIMAVSDGKEMIFSRVHPFDKESANDDLVKSLNYVLQRFKNIHFELFIGGDFDPLQPINTDLLIAPNLHIQQLSQHKHVPSILSGIKNFPKAYDFVPSRIQSKQLFRKIMSVVTSLLLLYLLYSSFSLLLEFNTLRGDKAQNKPLVDQYKQASRALEKTDPKDVALLAQLFALKEDAHNRKLFTLLKNLDPMKTMLLERLIWNNDDSEQFSIVFLHRFLNLKSFEAFQSSFVPFEAAFRRAYPKATIERSYDLSHLQVTLKIELKKRTRTRSRVGKVHG